MSSRSWEPHQRPLIDLIPTQDLDISDEEDDFYARDTEDYLIHPKWRILFNRLPRKLRRSLGGLALVLFLLLIVWWAYLGPQYRYYRWEIKMMETEPKEKFGSNARPAFKGLIMIKELEPKIVPKSEGRLVIVGDVHGCREELEHLLHKVQFQEGVDHLVLTGDMIAKGPDSPGVVSLATRLGASGVRGNHEDKVLLSLDIPEDPHTTYPPTSHPKGSPETQALASSFTAEQLTYLRALPVILHVGRFGTIHDLVVVHAGLAPNVPLASQDPFQVMNMRSINLATLLPSETRDFTPWAKYWNHKQKEKAAHERVTVVYGHDKKRGLNIKDWSMGLDTGCVGGGKLTAMAIKTSGEWELVHVKCRGYVT